MTLLCLLESLVDFEILARSSDILSLRYIALLVLQHWFYRTLFILYYRPCGPLSPTVYLMP